MTQPTGSGSAPAQVRPRTPRRGPEVTYRYEDAAGDLQYEIIRRPGKSWIARRPGPDGSWIKGIEGVTRVLYRLRELTQDTHSDIWILEGEKDVDRASTLGLLATTNPFGAYAHLPDLACLTGRTIRLVADRDDAGRQNAERWVAALRGVATKVTVLVAADGKDLSDHLDAGLQISDLTLIDIPIIGGEDVYPSRWTWPVAEAAIVKQRVTISHAEAVHRLRAPRHGQPWTDQELEHLLDSHRGGNTVETIAEELGRSINSVRAQLQAHMDGRQDP